MHELVQRRGGIGPQLLQCMQTDLLALDHSPLRLHQPPETITLTPTINPAHVSSSIRCCTCSGTSGAGLSVTALASGASTTDFRRERSGTAAGDKVRMKRPKHVSRRRAAARSCGSRGGAAAGPWAGGDVSVPCMQHTHLVGDKRAAAPPRVWPIIGLPSVHPIHSRVEPRRLQRRELI